MNAYLAHGLKIQSDRVLPPGVESAQEVGPFDLRITSGKVDWDPNADFSQGLFRQNEREHAYHWPEIGRISVSHDGTVVVDAKATVPSGLVEHVLLGPILADWFVRQGRLPLHASAVNTDAGLIGVVGPSGAGKSTLAAALVRQRGTAHGDDLLNVCPQTGRTPYGTARTKLNPDSLLALRHREDELSFVFAGNPKRALIQEIPQLGMSLREHAPPLRAIYRLAETQDAPHFERLHSMKAAFGLLMDVFMVDVQTKVLGPQALLQRCAELSSAVPVFLLHRRKDLSELDQLAAAVIAHAAQVESKAPSLEQ